MRRTYNSYLEVKVLTDLSSEGVTNMYADWKAAKVAEFSEARTKTNTENNAVNNALLLAQQVNSANHYCRIGNHLLSCT